MKSKLRICFVTEEFYPKFVGGQGIYSYKMVTNLAKLGHEVTVLAEYRAKRAEFWNRKKNIKVLLTPYCFKNNLILAFFEYFIFLIKLRKQYFDVLHANQLSGLLFALFKPKNVGKVIISSHHTNLAMRNSTKFWLKRFLYNPLIFCDKITFQHSDGMLFNSPSEQKEVSKYYELSNVTTGFVYLGVDMSKITLKQKNDARRKIRNSLKIPKENFVVIYLGRLVKKKRVETLINSINILNKSQNDISCIIVGTGAEAAALKSIAPNNVYFAGFVKDAEPYFMASDLFVTTSVAEGGFLLTALEAASFGLPLILSPSPAGFPIIDEGKNGFITPPNNAKLLAEKILKVMPKSKNMGLHSRQIAKKFSWQKSAQYTVKFYKIATNRTVDL